MTAIELAVVNCLSRYEVAGRVTVALSGGVDSMVLLDAAHRVLSAGALSADAAIELTATHVHHGLSPNADDWVAFCQRQCDARDIPLTVVRIQLDGNQTQGQGIEGAARTARYAALQAQPAATILAGQHADDQAETVLHQLLRGTGLAGLAAMGEMRQLPGGQRLMRPLIGQSRGSIEDYAAQRKLAWITDESNSDTSYTRNFIRHELLPVVEARFPQARAALTRAARHAAESAAMMEALAKIDLQWDGVVASAVALDELPLARQTNALYYWLKWQGINTASQSQLEDWAAQLFRRAPTDKPHQAGGHDFLIRRRRGTLVLGRY
ncbi:MAG: tRNA lysidine(34) synthetase TilS [Rhodocyclaceae bacterium]|nr:tRNA lysidine(34) synthetase TilS [Rhodocyclaceae bacterium]